MSKFAIVALLPQDETDPRRVDFVSREFDTANEIGAAIAELEEKEPNWRAVTICHTEDLPLLMEPPEGATGS